MRSRLVGPLLAVLVGAAAGVVLTRGDGDPSHPQDQDPEQPVAVTSDAPRLTSLGELVTTADVVVRAEVVATERGRLFGQPGGGSVESRLVTLEVDEVLAGVAPDDWALLVEEEGWLADGRPLVVDGDGLAGATGDDPLVGELADLSVEELAARIAALPSASP